MPIEKLNELLPGGEETESAAPAPDPAPAPAQNVKVSLNAQGNVKAYATSPDFGPVNDFIYAESQTSSITVPAVNLWSCVIFEVN